MTTHQCPACKETDTLRRSKLRLWERPLGRLGINSFRCKACSKRFHRRWSLPTKPLAQLGMTADAPFLKSASLNVPTIGIAATPATPYPAIPLNLPNAPASAPPVARARTKTRPWPRLRISPAVQYSINSFAVLLLLHFLVGALEFVPLGKAAMWVNVLSLVTLVGALLAFIDLVRIERAPTEAVRATAILVLRWAGLFLGSEAFYGFLLGPGEHGFDSDIALYRQQSPYIWMTYVVLPISGAIGCSAYLLLRPKLRRHT